MLKFFNSKRSDKMANTQNIYRKVIQRMLILDSSENDEIFINSTYILLNNPRPAIMVVTKTFVFSLLNIYNTQ